MLAVVYARRPYLLGHHFKILTDHRTIKHFLGLGERITTSVVIEIGYDYTISYRSGSHNAVPDALSRQAELKAIMGEPVFQYVQDIKQACYSDADTIIEELQRGQCSRKGYSLI